MIKQPFVNMYKILSFAAGVALCMSACKQPTKTNQPEESGKPTATVQNVNVPVFQTDSAYAYTAKQVSFGPRIPNTPAQQKCADWLIAQLKPLADTVYIQRTTVKGPKKYHYLVSISSPVSIRQRRSVYYCSPTGIPVHMPTRMLLTGTNNWMVLTMAPAVWVC